MNHEEKIIELEKKVKDLEILKENCSLTKDIKTSLVHYIESNEELKKKLKEICSEGKKISCENFYCLLIEFKFAVSITVMMVIAAIVYKCFIK